MNDAKDETPSARDWSEYFELLRFESVGAHPEKLLACRQCATWLQKWLGAIGAEAKFLLPEGVIAPPVLFAERAGSPGAPTILLYGHYDVQPPDPIEAWQTPPFEPTEKDGRVYCRGAQDDKGQSFAFLTGLRRFLESKPAVVPTFKFVLEGQEESGSEALTRLLQPGGALVERVGADVLLVCDTSAGVDLRPSIVAGLRGVVHFTIRLEGPARDLHSGEYGGIAPNPAQGMCELLASLHDSEGAIAVRGFSDGIEPPTAEEQALAEAAAMRDAALAETMGCPPVGGEAGLSPTMRNSFCPTIEVNGIHSGYGGPGSKTIIPASALAKVSMRLVPGQRVAAVRKAVEDHLKNHTPRGLKLFVEDFTGDAEGFRLPLASPVFRLAEDVLAQMDARGAAFQWDGASIPVISALKRVSGAAPLLVGWGQPEDCIHSPNESFGVNQFGRAAAWAENILKALVE